MEMKATEKNKKSSSLLFFLFLHDEFDQGLKNIDEIVSFSFEIHRNSSHSFRSDDYLVVTQFVLEEESKRQMLALDSINIICHFRFFFLKKEKNFVRHRRSSFFF